MEEITHSDNGVDTINPKTQRKRKPWVYLSDYEQVIKQKEKLESWVLVLGIFSLINVIYWAIVVFSHRGGF